MDESKAAEAHTWNDSRLEHHAVDEATKNDTDNHLILDSHGYPLRPQPSSDPNDPLNWNAYFKLLVLLQVSFLAFLGPFSQATANPAYALLAKYFHITITEASYSTTLCIVFAGVAPLLWAPLANVYGRRPIYLLVTIIGIVASAGSAVSTRWGPLLASRVFVGVGSSAGMGIGASVVSDLYYMHERGRYMGIYVVFVTNGAHVAAVVGGFIAKDIGWRWCYWIASITLGASLLFNLFLLPETLYRRDPATGQSLEPETSWISRFGLIKTGRPRNVRASDFAHCFEMLKYPSVTLAGLYYAYCFGASTILFAVTGAAAFGPIYHFNTAQIGLAIGLGTFVGTLVGEFASGPVSDLLLLLYRKRHDGVAHPEIRLQAIWPGFFLLPAGVIIEGVCLQYKTHWSGPVFGIGLGCFGLQIVSTNIYAYLADCYKPQGAEISTLLNFMRQTFGFTLGFYMIPFAHHTTYGIAWAVMAIVSIVPFIGIVALMIKGRQWREAMGAPKFDRDL